MKNLISLDRNIFTVEARPHKNHRDTIHSTCTRIYMYTLEIICLHEKETNTFFAAPVHLNAFRYLTLNCSETVYQSTGDCENGKIKKLINNV